MRRNRVRASQLCRAYNGRTMHMVGRLGTRCRVHIWHPTDYLPGFRSWTSGFSGTTFWNVGRTDYTRDWNFCKKCFPKGAVITDALPPGDTSRWKWIPVFPWKKLHAVESFGHRNYAACGLNAFESYRLPDWINTQISPVMPRCKSCERNVKASSNPSSTGKAWRKLVRTS